MLHYLNTSIRMAFLTILLLGFLYPLVMVGLGQMFFPRQANGSLIREGGVVRGSTLIGQEFTGPGYFHPRPSAAGKGYDALASGGSNLGPTSKALRDRVAKDVDQARGENPGMKEVPVDMVTTSGSGLDPDITLANAYTQAPRVARERKMPESALRALVRNNISHRQLGILGEPRVNVLQLNRALDAAQGRPAR